MRKIICKDENKPENLMKDEEYELHKNFTINV